MENRVERLNALTRAVVWFGLLCLGPGFAGCASIPRESVDLSRQVSVDIGKSRAAYLATLDAFFGRLRADNDAWVVDTFLPRAASNPRATLADACRRAGDDSPDWARIPAEGGWSGASIADLEKKLSGILPAPGRDGQPEESEP